MRDNQQKGREEKESEKGEEKRRKKQDRFWPADVSSRRKCLAHFPALCAWELFLALKGRSNVVHKFPEQAR